MRRKIMSKEAVKQKKHIAHHHVMQNNLLGIMYMLLHTLSLSFLYAVIKELTQGLNSSLVVFLYKFVILVAIIPWCLVGGIKSLKTDRIWLHISRGCLSTFGALCMFFAIKHIGLSDATAIGYCEQFLLLIIGIVYFKEKLTGVKLTIIATGLFGVFLILRPDLFEKGIVLQNELIVYYVFAFLGMSFWALNSTVIKVLGRTEKTKVQLFYVMLFSSGVAFFAAFMHWETVFSFAGIDIKYPDRWVEFSELGLQVYHIKGILVLGLCYFLHVVGHFKALKHAELFAVIPFEYTRLVFAGIFGYYFFDEKPFMVKTAGYALIVAASLFLFYSEKKKAKQKKLLQQADAEQEN